MLAPKIGTRPCPLGNSNILAPAAFELKGVLLTGVNLLWTGSYSRKTAPNFCVCDHATTKTLPFGSKMAQVSEQISCDPSASFISGPWIHEPLCPSAPGV